MPTLSPPGPRPATRTARPGAPQRSWMGGARPDDGVVRLLIDGFAAERLVVAFDVDEQAPAGSACLIELLQEVGAGGGSPWPGLGSEGAARGHRRSAAASLMSRSRSPIDRLLPSSRSLALRSSSAFATSKTTTERGRRYAVVPGRSPPGRQRRGSCRRPRRWSRRGCEGRPRLDPRSTSSELSASTTSSREPMAAPSAPQEQAERAGEESDERAELEIPDGQLHLAGRRWKASTSAAAPSRSVRKA